MLGVTEKQQLVAAESLQPRITLAGKGFIGNAFYLAVTVNVMILNAMYAKVRR